MFKYISISLITASLLFSGCSDSSTDKAEIVKDTKPVIQNTVVNTNKVEKVDVVNTPDSFNPNQEPLFENKPEPVVEKPIPVQLPEIPADELKPVQLPVIEKNDIPSLDELEKNIINKSNIESTISLTACTSCHGQSFEKAALGKSKIVKDMTEEDIFLSLSGYKDGTYGGVMKNIMTSQVSKFTKDELIIISQKIKEMK